MIPEYEPFLSVYNFAVVCTAALDAEIETAVVERELMPTPVDRYSDEYRDTLFKLA